MKTRRKVLTAVNLVILPLLLFHFQNCGSPSHMANASAGQVSVIEDQSKAQLQFVTPDVEVQDDAASTGIDGLCNSQHDGAQLRWTIAAGNEATTPLVAGTSVCKTGQFSVGLDQLDQFVCGVDHLLVVEGDWGGSTSTHLTRRCQPLASQPTAAPADSPVGTNCSLEYSPASAAEQPCEEVCYRDNKVVFTQSQDVGQCSALKASLVGP